MEKNMSIIDSRNKFCDFNDLNKNTSTTFDQSILLALWDSREANCAKPLPPSTRFNDPERFSLDQLKNNKSRLRSFKDLRRGWNGYNGNPIDESIITIVENLLTALDYQPQIFPTGRGTLQLEWFLDENNQIEIEISKEIAYLYQVKNGEEKEMKIEISEINDFVSDLFI